MSRDLHSPGPASRLPGRLLLAGIALACGLLLALWLGPARAEQRAAKVAYGDPQRARGATVRTALADAHRARRLAPDVPAKVLEWQLLFANGQGRKAERLLREMSRDEPSNFGVWLLVASVSTDERFARHARQRQRELNPRAARSR